MGEFYHADLENAYRKDKLLLSLFYKWGGTKVKVLATIDHDLDSIGLDSWIAISASIVDKNFRTLSRIYGGNMPPIFQTTD